MRFNLFLFLILTFSCTPKRGKVVFKEGGEIKEGTAKLYCDPPKKRYTKELQSKVKSEIESLSNIPASELELSLTNKVIRLADYSSVGLDKDLILFRICEMSINRGMTNEQTFKLIEQTIKTWDNTILPRKLDAIQQKIILESIEIEKNKIACNSNCKIIVQYPEMATDGYSFGIEVLNFIRESGYDKTHIQGGIASGEHETKFMFSSHKDSIWVIIPKRKK